MASSNKDKRKTLSEIARRLSFVTQLGLALIMPVLLCIWGCVFLMNRFGIGGWIFIPGFILGLGASFMTAYKFYIAESLKSNKDKDKQKVNFNRHT